MSTSLCYIEYNSIFQNSSYLKYKIINLVVNLYLNLYMHLYLFYQHKKIKEKFIKMNKEKVEEKKNKNIPEIIEDKEIIKNRKEIPSKDEQEIIDKETEIKEEKKKDEKKDPDYKLV